MQSTPQVTITNALNLASAAQTALANPVGAGVKLFRTLDKDTQALIIGLLSIAGLIYALNHLTGKR